MKTTQPSTTTPTPAIQPQIDPKEMAQAIAKIGDTFSALMKAGLKRRTIIILIHHETKVPQRDIELVLNHLEAFKRVWTTMA